MTLGSALQIGRSGLLTSQTAIENIGQNLANVSTPGYHRRTVQLKPVQGSEIQNGIFAGRGVQVDAIVRHVSTALENRLRSSVSDQAFSQARQSTLKQIEATENEFTEIDLSSNLSQFFDAMSELSNTPNDFAKRTLVVEQSSSLAIYMQSLSKNLTDLQGQTGDQIQQSVTSLNKLLGNVANINKQISTTERAGGGANDLRDQRSQLLTQVSQMVDISLVEQNTGMVDVFVGSIPVVLGDKNRGIKLETTTQGDRVKYDLQLKSDSSPLMISSGRIAGLIDSAKNQVQVAIDELNGFAKQLIFQVNKIHSQGQGTHGMTSITSSNRVEDANAALNSAEANLGFTPTHGSFQISVTQTTTGKRSTSEINIDLDGLGTDTSLNDLATQINAVDNITAVVNAAGQLEIKSAGSDFEISFGNDSASALAALGINSFFTGKNASDIAANVALSKDPGLVAAAQGHVSGDNSNALAMSQLRDTKLDDLRGISLTEKWNQHVETFAIKLGQSDAAVQAADVVHNSLATQQQSVSGVNVDEEVINLLAFQRAYQGSARFLKVVDDMMQTLMQLIR